MKTSLVHVTPQAESTIAYCARVSSPENQKNEEIEKLLGYCIKHGHWSIFEMANLCVEIETTRAIAQQILRHRSFHFQEFSQRYACVYHIDPQEVRRQDTKNRQNSLDDLDPSVKEWFMEQQLEIYLKAMDVYNQAIVKGIAKECARFILPLATETRLYMNGTVRDWIHYLKLRCGNGTQKEHALIAQSIKDAIFIPQFPRISKALGWA